MENSDQDINKLYAFVAEQVTAGLFKSDIIDKLLNLGVAPQTASDLLEEMERRLETLRKRTVLVLMSGREREAVLYEFFIAGYAAVGVDGWRDVVPIVERRVPDLIIVNWSSVEGGSLMAIERLRQDTIARHIPMFVLDDRCQGPVVSSLESVHVFAQGTSPRRLVDEARGLFLRSLGGGAGNG